jgi:hypothetical protein
MGNRATQKSGNVPVHSQRFFATCFKGFVAFDTFRFKHPIIFSLLASIIVMVLVYFITQSLHIQDMTNPKWWTYTGFFSCANVSRALISLVCGIFFTQPLARGLLPMLTIVPQAIAMKNLGLVFVTTNHKESARLFRKAFEEHDQNAKVKIICISGRYLFRELNLPTENAPPLALRDLAVKGQLEVVMPVSDVNNPTIKARYETYSKEFVEANGIQTVKSFVDYEIEASKDFLKTYKNPIFEHNILCMWRVIIFSEHVLVQNYFPNPTKSDSFRAPVFMYSKRVDGSEPHSYYDMYVAMFDLVKGVSQKRT